MMLVCDATEQLKRVVRLGHHRKDGILRKRIIVLSQHIKNDEAEEEIPGFPNLNSISQTTIDTLKEVSDYCNQVYDFDISF